MPNLDEAAFARMAGDTEKNCPKRLLAIATLLAGPSIGTENLIPEEVNDAKIAIGVPVMNKVQLLMRPKPRKFLKP